MSAHTSIGAGQKDSAETRTHTHTHTHIQRTCAHKIHTNRRELLCEYMYSRTHTRMWIQGRTWLEAASTCGCNSIGHTTPSLTTFNVSFFVCVYTRACMNVYIYMYRTYIHARAYTHMHAYTCMYVCIYMYCTYIHARVYTCIRVHVCICIYMYRTYIHVCIYIEQIQTQTSTLKHIYTCTYIFMYIYTYRRSGCQLHVCVHMYYITHTHKYKLPTLVHIYINTYIYVHIYI